MRTVGAFEAKAKIAELLDEVAKGRRVLITRRGAAAALMVPPRGTGGSRARRMEEIKRFRKSCRTGRVDIEALIAEGRP